MDERKAIIDTIRKLQKIQHSDFISGDALVYIIENGEHLEEEKKKDVPWVYEGWD